MSRREQPKIFVLHLTAGPNCPDEVRALRQLPKIALRRFGLRCVSIEQQVKGEASEAFGRADA
jgi:hypothetical protein